MEAGEVKKVVIRENTRRSVNGDISIWRTNFRDRKHIKRDTANTRLRTTTPPTLPMLASKTGNIQKTNLKEMASRLESVRQELDTINTEHGFLLTDVFIADCYTKKIKERNDLEKRIQIVNAKSQKHATTGAPTLPRPVSLPSVVVTNDSRSSTPEMPSALDTDDPTDGLSDQPAAQTKKTRNYWKWDSELGKLRGLTILTALVDLRTDDDQVR